MSGPEELLTRKQLAGRLGVSPNTIWRWENGGKIAKPKKRVRDGVVLYSEADAARIEAWMWEAV